MHPATILLLTLTCLLAVQAMGGWPLAALAGGIALACNHWHSWWRWLQRSRALLACLWLVMAYGAAGEAIAGLSWAPTFEGLAAANLHAGRLVVSLGLLAWMFERLDHATLPLALWSLLLPLRRLGCQVDRLVVRLALVLEHLAEGLPGAGWPQLVRLEQPPAAAPGQLRFACPAWRIGDGLCLLAAFLFCWGLILT